MDALPGAGISIEAVTAKLVEDGVRLFADAADQLYAAVAEKAPHRARPQAQRDELQAAGSAGERGPGRARGLAPRGQGPAAMGRRRLAVDRNRRGEMARLADRRRSAAESRAAPPGFRRRRQTAPGSGTCCCSAWAGRASAPRCSPRPSARSPAFPSFWCSTRPTRRRSAVSTAGSIRRAPCSWCRASPAARSSPTSSSSISSSG